MSNIIYLPWPSRVLHPNSRPRHWAVKSKAVKAAREAAGWATKAAKVKVEGDGAITLKITFRPPDKRRRDLDGMFASMKSAFDGIADAMGVDDCRFRFEIGVGNPYVDGIVLVEVVSIADGVDA